MLSAVSKPELPRWEGGEVRKKGMEKDRGKR